MLVANALLIQTLTFLFLVWGAPIQIGVLPHHSYLPGFYPFVHYFIDISHTFYS
jgi:hypothetical protein